ncbi:hypothetical protein Tco_1038620 [Tanacetum coccineum]
MSLYRVTHLLAPLLGNTQNVGLAKWSGNNVTKLEAHSNGLVLDDIILSDPETKALELPYHVSLEALDRAHRIRQKKEVPSASLLH